MPRMARERSKTGVYHIMLRGINRQTIFGDDGDREKFLLTLKKYQMISEFKLYAYCLMGNHIHLLLKEEKEELGITMRRIGSSYVYWYNWKYERCGHLFQDRYKSETVEADKYLLAVLRYIHQNPLKAGLVKNLADYKWSSYNEYVGVNQIINTDFLLNVFHPDRDKAVDSFKKFHATIGNDLCLDVDDMKKVKDEEAIEMIKRICCISCCTEIQLLDAEVKSRFLKVLKGEGLSTRQIARLTGVSRGLVLKA